MPLRQDASPRRLKHRPAQLSADSTRPFAHAPCDDRADIDRAGRLLALRAQRRERRLHASRFSSPAALRRGRADRREPCDRRAAWGPGFLASRRTRFRRRSSSPRRAVLDQFPSKQNPRTSYPPRSRSGFPGDGNVTTDFTGIMKMNGCDILLRSSVPH